MLNAFDKDENFRNAPKILSLKCEPVFDPRSANETESSPIP
jgi:hypothetical protein